jgi:hypothetical protein
MVPLEVFPFPKDETSSSIAFSPSFSTLPSVGTGAGRQGDDTLQGCNGIKCVCINENLGFGQEGNRIEFDKHIRF